MNKPQHYQKLILKKGQYITFKAKHNGMIANTRNKKGIEIEYLAFTDCYHLKFYLNGILIQIWCDKFEVKED